MQNAGHKIPTIENLGAAGAGDHDAIDFTDNDINALANFPYSPRLQTLLLARNRVNVIQKNLSKNVPNLQTLVLTGNYIAELADLEPLRVLGRLTWLSLLENPVQRKEVCYVTQAPVLHLLTYVGGIALSSLPNLADSLATVS